MSFVCWLGVCLWYGKLASASFLKGDGAGPDRGWDGVELEGGEESGRVKVYSSR